MQPEWPRDLAVGILVGFATFVVALPVSCLGYLLLFEHAGGTTDSAGPVAILNAMGAAALLGLAAATAVTLLRRRDRWKL